MNKSKPTIVRTVCRECHAGCGMYVHVADGRAIKIEGIPDSPDSEAKLCSRAAAGLERLYHPRRLKFPQRRAGKRGSGKWERITWEEALD